MTSVPGDAGIGQRIRESFARMQAMVTIGASLSAVRPGEVEIVLPFSAALTQQHGFIHAGVIATIGDTAWGIAPQPVVAKAAAGATPR